MSTRLRDVSTLRELLATRALTMDAAAILAGVDTATISRICSGQVRPTPRTVVRLATALGINARRMQRLCDAAWQQRDGKEPRS